MAFERKPYVRVYTETRTYVQYVVSTAAKPEFILKDILHKDHVQMGDAVIVEVEPYREPTPIEKALFEDRGNR